MSFAHLARTDVKAARVSTQTLTLTKCSKSSKTSSKKGFTLIEVMIVMAIIAAVISIGIGRVNTSGNELKETLRRMSTMSRQLHSLAKLNTATYRLVIDLDSGQEDAEQSYWIERALGSTILSTEDFSKKFDPNVAEDEEAPPNPGGFVMDQKVLKSPRKVPKGARVVLVHTSGSQEAVESGQAYIYFFPQGLADEAVVQIESAGDKVTTLAVRPLTGKMDILNGRVTLKDLSQ